MKKTIIIILAIAVIATGYWLSKRYGWFGNEALTNPPTAQEIKRMKEIEKSSSQIAPDAVPGAGVRPAGTLPKPTPVETEATTTEEKMEID